MPGSPGPESTAAESATAQAPPSSLSSRRALLLLALLCLIWGSTWIFIKWGLGSLPVFGSAALRFGVAFLVMLLIAPWLHRREGGRRPPAAMWIILGVTNFALSYGIVYWSESQLPSGIVAVLWSVFPMMMALMAHVFLDGERLHLRSAAGFGLGFAGIAVLFHRDLATLGPDAIPAGLILLISPLVSAAGTIYVKRGGRDVSSVLLNRNAMGLGALLLGITAWLAEPNGVWHWDAPAIISILYLGVIGTCLTFGLYFWLMRRTRAAQLSLIAYVTPCVALLLGWAIGGETYGVGTAAGTMMVLAGVALVGR